MICKISSRILHIMREDCQQDLYYLAKAHFLKFRTKDSKVFEAPWRNFLRMQKMQRFQVSRDGCAAFDGGRLVSKRLESKSAQCGVHTQFSTKNCKPAQPRGRCERA